MAITACFLEKREYVLRFEFTLINYSLIPLVKVIGNNLRLKHQIDKRIFLIGNRSD